MAEKCKGAVLKTDGFRVKVVEPDMTYFTDLEEVANVFEAGGQTWSDSFDDLPEKMKRKIKICGGV